METKASERPFDAVLIISFGGPRGRNDIRPFLQNIIGGRTVQPERIEEIVHRYELFDGESPITEITRRQADGLYQRLKHMGLDLPVYVGMRNWHPFLVDTLCTMAEAGVRRAIGFIAAAHQCYSSCGQYKQDVIEARQILRQRGLPEIQVSYVQSWYDHPGFIAAHARRINEALARLPAELGDSARIIFTAHSIPLKMAQTCCYREQLATSAKLIADKLERGDYVLVYQSRSGLPTESWLEPDICDYLEEHQTELESAVISPIGFVCDHIELLYDLDHEAAGVCRKLNIPMVRATSLNDHPLFIDMIADVVQQTCG